MDSPGNKTPPIFSASNMGGNNHMRPTHIINTLHADKAARREARQTNQRFAGDQRIFSLPGNVFNNRPNFGGGNGGGFGASIRSAIANILGR
jgi:hypothetical protein